MLRHFAFLFLFLFSAYGSAAEVTLFMAVNGTGDGSSPSSPVATLQQAQTKVQSVWATQPLANIVVKIAPGTYVGQYVSWTTVNKDASLAFEAQDPNAPPVFDGQGKIVNVFFKLSHTGGKSNLAFRSLHIKRYLTAIQFYADRENFSRNNSNNEITDCTFEEIGNAYWQGAGIPEPTSALNFVNSDANTIKRNSFKKIRNLHEHGEIVLHSIYLAHNSNNNVISENFFEDASGSFVRIRDYSNANIVTRNEFARTDQIAVDTWYCVEPFEDLNNDGIDDVERCTKTNEECPSIDNSIYKNSFSATSTFFAEHIGYNANNTDCRIPIPAINNIVQQNVDVSPGRCLIRSMKGCADFALPAETFVQDYLSQEAQGNSTACSVRAQHYYGSCTSRTGDLNDVMTTRMQSTTPGLYYDAHYGSGCLTQTQNCERMSMPDRTDVLDTGTNAQQDKNVCLQRNTTWYSSCSRNDATGFRFNRQKYITGKVEEIAAAGHGCVIYANFCPRMGIEENGFRMDTQTATHTDAAACLARAPAWWSSCTANLTNPSAVNVEARFYQNGKLSSVRKYP
jgi:hypothetical protein